jgi:mannosyltransferase
LRSRITLAISSIIIIAVVIALRLPSCGESFWVDELHTAWTIHDDLADVLPRAHIGHQQPYYFGLLWIWRQVFGESELALRMTSALSVAVASVILNVAVARSTGVAIAGLASGMFLAIESNSIFFGTELRPYAVVMLASAAACSFAVRAWNEAPSQRSAAWVMLFVSLGIAAIMQLTSLGILGWLPFVVLARWCWIDWRAVFRPRRTDALVLLVIIAVVYLSMPRHILETWNTRSLWSSFASAHSVNEIWRLWPWLVGIVLPAGWFALNSILTWQFRFPAEVSFATSLAMILVGSTCVFWLVSSNGIAPLWHHRFMIAGLPMLAWIFGAMIGGGAGRWSFRRSWQNVLCLAVSISLLALLGYWSQDKLPRISKNGWQLVFRGENWRGAIDHVNQRAQATDAVAINAGLIEQAAWHNEIAKAVLKDDLNEYLSYPVRGPYQLSNAASVVAVNLSPMNHWAMTHQRGWLISRGPASRLKVLIQEHVRVNRIAPNSLKIDVRSFGGVSVALVEKVSR